MNTRCDTSDTVPVTGPAPGPVRAVLEAMPDAVLALSHDGRVCLFNRVATRMFGYSAVEVIGRHASLLLPHHLRAGAVPGESLLFELADAGGSSCRRGVARRKDGSAFPIEVSTGSMAIAAEIWHIAVIRDTSDRLVIEAQMRRLNEALAAQLTDRGPGRDGPPQNPAAPPELF